MGSTMAEFSCPIVDTGYEKNRLNCTEDSLKASKCEDKLAHRNVKIFFHNIGNRDMYLVIILLFIQATFGYSFGVKRPIYQANLKT